MTDRKITGRNDRARKAWQAPVLDRFHAGSAETGNVGMGGEANTQS